MHSVATQVASRQRAAGATLLRGSVQLIRDHASAWTALCESAPDDVPFYHPEWVGAWVEAFAPQNELMLAASMEGTQFRALLPLIRKQAPFCGIPARILQGAGNEHSCRFDLIREGGDGGTRGVKEIWESLRRLGDWDVIELPLVPEGGAAEELLLLAARDGFLTGKYESDRSAFISLSPGETAEKVPHDAHFRQNLRRRMRKAQAASTVRLERFQRAAVAELTRFYELERSGWKGAGKTGIADSEVTRRFYDLAAKAMAEHGWLSLYLLEFGDQVAAGHFGVEYRGRYYCPKVAYDETQANLGPGHLIILTILEDLLARGFQEFDFVGPWMEWKGEWARGARQHHYCYIFRPTPLGRLLKWAQFELRPALRPWKARVRSLQSRLAGK